MYRYGLPWLRVLPPDLLIYKGAQLDTRDVLQSDRGTIWILADDDVAEFFRADQSSGSSNGVRKLLALRRRFRSDLASGIDGALLLHGVRQIRNSEAQLRQLIGLHPDAHGIIGSAKVCNLTDAWDTQKGVIDVDGCVVAKELSAIGAVR